MYHRRRTLWDKYLRVRSNWRHMQRKLFISPAEVKFVEVMGGKSFTLPFIKSPKTDFPLTFMWLGRVLKRELIEHDVRIGRYWADFATPGAAYRKIIEIDGDPWHSSKLDIVKEQEREDYLHERGWSIYRIRARRLWREPKRVREDVLKFLKS